MHGQNRAASKAAACSFGMDVRHEELGRERETRGAGLYASNGNRKIGRQWKVYPVCVGGRVATAVVCLASSLRWCFDIPKACQTMGGSFVLPGDRYHRPVEDENH